MVIYLVPFLIINFFITSAGYTLLNKTQLLPEESTERLLTTLGTGWITVALATYILGWLGLLSSKDMFLILVIITFLGISQASKFLRDLKETWKDIWEGLKPLIIQPFNRPTGFPSIWNWFAITATASLTVTTIFITLVTFTPPAGWDALNYHLSVPKTFLLQGKITNLPTRQFSHFPLPVQFMYLFLMGIGNDILAQSLQLLFFGGVLLTMWQIIKRFLPETSTLMALTILFSIPVVLFVVPEAHVEIAAAFYATLSLLMFLVYRQTQEHKYLHLSFIFIAFTGAIKYTTLPLILTIPIMLILYEIAEKKKKKGTVQKIQYLAKFMSLFATYCLLFTLPFYLRTWYYVGNPFWPFFLKLFPSKYPPNSYTNGNNIPAVSEIIEPDMDSTRLQNTLKLLKKSLTKVVRMSFFPREFGGDAPKIGALPIGLLPTLFSLTWSRNDHEQLPVILYILLFISTFFLIWLPAYHNLRYLVPIYPSLAILLATGVKKTFAKKLWLRQFTNLIILISLGISSLITLKDHYRKIPAALGLVNRQEYYSTTIDPWSKSLRFPEYAASRWINKNLDPQKDKVLILQDIFGYFLEIPYEKGRPDTQSKYDFTKVSSPKDIEEMLKKNGITYILTTLAPEPQKEKRPTFQNKDLEKDLHARSDYGYQFLHYDFLPNHAKLVFEENQIYVYKVK